MIYRVVFAKFEVIFQNVGLKLTQKLKLTFKESLCYRLGSERLMELGRSGMKLIEAMTNYLEKRNGSGMELEVNL